MRNYGHNISISSKVIIIKPFSVTIEDNVIINSDVWINIEGLDLRDKIIIGAGTSIGKRNVISCAKSICIGKKVLLGPNILISDHMHAYENVKYPVMDQGITKVKNVVIKDGAWLGANTVVMPGVTIGKNSVIGANSIVSKSIPDYSVAIGSPAKVIKKFDFKSKSWKKCS